MSFLFDGQIMVGLDENLKTLKMLRDRFERILISKYKNKKCEDLLDRVTSFEIEIKRTLEERSYDYKKDLYFRDLIDELVQEFWDSGYFSLSSKILKEKMDLR